jgi:hypothetical protein
MCQFIAATKGKRTLQIGARPVQSHQKPRALQAVLQRHKFHGDFGVLATPREYRGILQASPQQPPGDELTLSLCI